MVKYFFPLAFKVINFIIKLHIVNFKIKSKLNQLAMELNNNDKMYLHLSKMMYNM